MAGRQSGQDIKKETLLQSLEKGSSISRACEAANVGRSTFYEWVKDDPRFRELVRQSEAASIASMEDALWVTGMKGHVTAQIFFLTNRDPDRWKDVKRVESEDVTKKTDADLDREINSYLAKLQGESGIPVVDQRETETPGFEVGTDVGSKSTVACGKDDGSSTGAVAGEDVRPAGETR